jgi:hypothetical protein
MMKKIFIFLFLNMSIATYASFIVYGNATTTPYGFTSPIVATTFDQSSGTFYLGVENSSSVPSSTFSLAKATRPSQSKLASFSGIGTDPQLVDQTIEFLTMIPRQINEPGSVSSPFLGIGLLNDATPFTQNMIMASNTTGNSVVTSIALNDAMGGTTSGIVQNAANSGFMLPALLPNANLGGIFGDQGSGIGLVNVQTNPLTLTTLDATTGLPGNNAIPFDDTITQLKGDSGGNNVIFSTVATDANQVAMYYDEVLNRFYIGVLISTGTAATDIGKTIVVAQTNPTEGNQIELNPIVSDSAIDPAANQIIAAQGANVNLRAFHIGVMHCSTGPDYLIVNGGEGLTSQVSNLIFAMPLVNDSENEQLNGTLANANSALATDSKNTFTIPAEGMGDLLQATDARAMVGGGTLPIQANQPISDMVIVGDAVYVSIDIAPEYESPSNDTGIFFSQALFGASGEIASWSPWKRATPFDAFAGTQFSPTLSHDGQVKFFNIDARTGNAWIVEGTTDKLVAYTNWTTGQDDSGLLTQLNKLLAKGCYSGLDLNQQTRGFLNATDNSYALFGGVNKVVIARTSQSTVMTSTASPQEVVTNFDSNENIYVNELPDNESSESCPMGAGCPSVLEYSRRTAAEGDTNYFFAGTENGLYAFSDDGNGFNATTLGLLNEAPFINGEWSKIDIIPGAVIDIKTSGAKLYVLTQEKSKEQPFIITLYSIEFQDTLATMFDEPNLTIIAQNNIDNFADISAFFAVAIISTGDPSNALLTPTKEQLILATSDGLFQSNADQNPGNGIIDATSQSDANWELINGTDGTAFNGIGFMDVPTAYTVWPISIADSNHHFRTFDRSNINQLSGTGNADGTQAEIGTLEPEFFNANSSNCAFNTLYPITYFWSDGGRRFFLINRTTSGAPGAQIAVLPFNVDESNIQQMTPLANAAFQQFRSANWIRSIGATGLIIAGTNQGVVGLE